MTRLPVRGEASGRGDRRVSFRYAASEIRAFFLLLGGDPLDGRTRSLISRRVKPSGKMIRSGLAGAGRPGGGGGATFAFTLPIPATAARGHAKNSSSTASAPRRRTSMRRRETRRRGGGAAGRSGQRLRPRDSRSAGSGRARVRRVPFLLARRASSKRSSEGFDRDIHHSAQRLDEGLRLPRLIPTLAAQRQRHPDHHLLGTLVADERGDPSEPCLGCGLLDDAERPRQGAGRSETATPVRARPKSRATTFKSGQKLAGLAASYASRGRRDSSPCLAQIRPAAAAPADLLPARARPTASSSVRPATVEADDEEVPPSTEPSRTAACFCWRI